ncbi:MAG: tRNA (adenosine(37)-N6)-threonylcarbamoyltransferase complex dimerization subunit type 1 TsaB [Candidatus Omnitrophica bacterium]|nr:tRNA (adenosine(37)-N6)-threonylcarbamoyltransferase complex dimerization subunit type 1 TsaB [Candidatus Omnitrophota bacterium]
MLILAADTSTDSLSVSIIDEEKVRTRYDLRGILRHSSLLMPTIKRALKKIGADISEIDLFSVGLGPGSFTGLRVGVTAIRALAIATDRPIIGVPTLDVIAHNGAAYLKKKKQPVKRVKVCPILDAKKKQVYSCIYSYNGDKIKRESGYLLEPVDALIKRLRGEVLFLGDGIPIYKEQLLRKKSLKADFLDAKKWFPKAAVIAKTALAEYRKGKRDDPYDLVPMYLYARDCNVRKR